MTTASRSRHPFELLLSSPLRTSTGLLERRAGFLVKIVDIDGIVGWGEASPLPGWPGPGLAEVAQQLDAWVSDKARPAGGPALAAIETAELDCAAQQAGISLAAFLNPESRSAVPVNLLLDAVEPTVLAAETEAALAAGYRTIKLKVAAGADDVARVEAVRSAAPLVALRLDANRGWDHETAVHFCEAVGHLGIEFIEEPVAGGIPALQQLQSEVSIAIAADESLAEIPAEALVDVPVGTLVLKPSALGNLRQLRSLAEHKRVVVTSFIDSAVGVTMALHLAAAMAGERLAAGLATSSRFATDVAASPLLANGSIIVPQTPGLGLSPKI